MSHSSDSDPTATVTHGQKGIRKGRPLALGYFVVHSHDEPAIGKRFPIGKSVTIGRTSGDATHVVIQDPSLSRIHAKFGIAKNQNGCSVEDQGSKNGTYLNGQRIDRGIAECGHVVRLGTTIGIIEEILSKSPIKTGAMLGRSPALLQAIKEIDKVAVTPLSVLIQGESGTGKELAAQRIHEESGRQGPFIAVNCGAIPENLVESTLFGHIKGAFTGATQDQEGVFASARGGTLFLDEVGELPITVQPKLLRALETHEFTRVGRTRTEKANVRIVSATNQDLMQSVANGIFRLDLQARLEGYRVQLPPLRERKLDILLLARHFLEVTAPQRTFEWSADFAETLLLYSWPTNIRGLLSAMRRIALLHENNDPLTSASLPAEIRETDSTAPSTTEHPLSEVTVTSASVSTGTPSREDLVHLARKYSGNVARISKELNKDRKQVYRWFKKHDLDPVKYR
jgi:transcriptional regulator with GAF, ATPase, and Fis domain